jgi:hypothetical protein
MPADERVERHEKTLMPDAVSMGRNEMGGAEYVSGWDTTILMIPFLAILVMYLFRLDQSVSAPKATQKKRRFFCGVDPKDRPYLSDPDGQPWRHHCVAKSKPD